LDLDELSQIEHQVIHPKSLDYESEPASKLRISSPISDQTRAGTSSPLPEYIRTVSSGSLPDHLRDILNEGYYIYDEAAWDVTVTSGDCSRLPCFLEDDRPSILPLCLLRGTHRLSRDLEKPLIDDSPQGFHIDAADFVGNGSVSLEQQISATELIWTADVMKGSNELVHANS
jgi:hypothetical protein